MQRCFSSLLLLFLARIVFSAHAEMFPALRCSPRRSVCFLCTCRDVSNAVINCIEGQMFSLHMQRCFQLGKVSKKTIFVFSAHAEMFLVTLCRSTIRLSFLCTCRDVSMGVFSMKGREMFSLHMQRCFQQLRRWCASQAVFSAHAEMFPS